MTKTIASRLVCLALAVGALAGCSKSDEDLAKAVNGAGHASDIFVNLCYSTKADPERVKHIASLAKWEVVTNLPAAPKGKLNGAWKVTVENHPTVIFSAEGPDDRSGSPTAGKIMKVCGLEYLGEQEPDFVGKVAGQMGDLKKIDPTKLNGKLPPDTELLSDTGEQNAGFQVTLMRPPFLTSHMVMALAAQIEK